MNPEMLAQLCASTGSLARALPDEIETYDKEIRRAVQADGRRPGPHATADEQVNLLWKDEMTVQSRAPVKPSTVIGRHEDRKGLGAW